MLIAANALDSLKSRAGINLLVRREKKTASVYEPRVKNGLGIGPLRATGGLPGVLGVGRKTTEASPLVTPPESGLGLMGKLQAQVRSVSPLTGGLNGSKQPRSFGALQAGLIKARQNFQKLDNSSRLLQAKANPLRASRGFVPKIFSTSALDLLG